MINFLFTFNRQLFYILLNLLAHIINYAISKKYIFLYLNIVKQTTKTLNLRLTFANGLIKTLKYNKSFTIA